MSKKDKVYFSKSKAYIVFGLAVIAIVLVIVGSFNHPVWWLALVGFGCVIAAAVCKTLFFRCPSCGSRRASKYVNFRFEAFNCPECKKRINFK